VVAATSLDDADNMLPPIVILEYRDGQGLCVELACRPWLNGPHIRLPLPSILEPCIPGAHPLPLLSRSRSSPRPFGSRLKVFSRRADLCTGQWKSATTGRARDDKATVGLGQPG
jgi:hypothetical protein